MEGINWPMTSILCGLGFSCLSAPFYAHVEALYVYKRLVTLETLIADPIYLLRSSIKLFFCFIPHPISKFPTGASDSFQQQSSALKIYHPPKSIEFSSNYLELAELSTI
jgi:hypothetical protein